MIRQRSLGTLRFVLFAGVAFASLACSSEADDPNFWAQEGEGGAGGQSAAAGGSGGNVAGGTGNPGTGVLDGLWVWEKRVHGDVEQSGEVDNGLMRVAFGMDNNKCHYIWNEITGSDFQTECTYTISGDMVTFNATADPDGTAAGYSCAHADWTSWNDRPAIQWGRYKFLGDRLWIGVNAYWGFGGNVTLSDGSQIPGNNSLKRFPFWESQGQAETTDTWIVFRPATTAEWCNECNQPEMCTQ